MRTDISNGLEDMRAIVHDNDAFVVGTSHQVSATPGFNSAFFARLDIEETRVALDRFIMLKKPNASRIEKNWIPVVYRGKLAAVYKLYPLTLIDLEAGGEFAVIDTGARKHVEEPFASELTKMYGSTNFAKYNDNYIGIVHSSQIIDGHKHYAHYWI
jgi:hypothetical protein